MDLEIVKFTNTNTYARTIFNLLLRAIFCARLYSETFYSNEIKKSSFFRPSQSCIGTAIKEFRLKSKLDPLRYFQM